MPGKNELVKLKARAADIDEELQKLKTNRSLSAGEKLLKRHDYERERKKLELRTKLLYEQLPGPSR